MAVNQTVSPLDYAAFFEARIAALKAEGRYRYFIPLERLAGEFPKAIWHHPKGPRPVTVWCANDYLVQGQSQGVLAAMKASLDAHGAGAGGTRNISGTHQSIVQLEQDLADWHGKAAALVMTSGYVANWAALSTIARQLPHCIVFSDAFNHSSMIEGLRHARVEKRIFKHNDATDLRRLLREAPPDCAKLIACESLYSMDGDQAPLADFVTLAREYGALLYLDEVHAVGLYGGAGAGVAAAQGVAEQVDILQGTLGKAIGQIGGYIAASESIVDFVRSYAPGFIFTTALPPHVAAGARASLAEIRAADTKREALHRKAAALRQSLLEQGIPLFPTPSHIIPAAVNDAELCRAISDALLEEYGVYVQPINYPTVPRGTERLRITVSPAHRPAMMQELTKALAEVMGRFGLAKAA